LRAACNNPLTPDVIRRMANEHFNRAADARQIGLQWIPITALQQLNVRKSTAARVLAMT
jgi:hypothetical protein